MSRKILQDLDIINELNELYDLPDDPEVSDDNLESDEETIQISTAKLQRILENFDEPNDGPLPPTPDPPNSPASLEIQPSVECQPKPSVESDRPRRVARAQDLPSSTSTQQTTSRSASPVDNSHSDSETDDSDGEEETWKKTKWTTFRPDPSVYDEIPLQPENMFSNRIRPVTLFEKYFTDEVYDLIIYQTNLYAEQKNDANWTKLDKKELRAFLAIFIIMGYNILPSMDLYWSTDPGFRVDEIAGIMTIKRFKKILQHLHLNDNTQHPERSSENYDKLYKVRPLLDLINHACQKNAKDSSSQSIDESMILFKGRSSMKQYMPLKPIKRGYKVWCRCDSNTGYLYEFYIYTGKLEVGSEVGLGFKVVKMLTEKLIDKALEEFHVIVTFDNFFCDYSIMQYLYENGIFATGTVRRHRKELPKLVKSNPKLQKGQYKWRVKGNVSCLIWKDTKDVLLMSNAFHPKSGKTTILRTQKDGTKTAIDCPLAIKEYTKRMGGVDRFDQLKGTYSVGRRSKRWWVRIFYFLLDTSITNAYLLYCQNRNVTKLSTLEFRVSVARGLNSGFSNRKRRSGLVNYVSRKKSCLSENRQKSLHVIAEEIRYTNVGDHMPVELPSYKRCRMCSTKEKDKRSKIMCSKCGVALCILPCFTAFHKE